MLTTSSSLIEPEDVVDVTISSGLEEAGITPTPVRVDNNGIATIALVGQVALAGLEPFQAGTANCDNRNRSWIIQGSSSHRHNEKKSR